MRCFPFALLRSGFAQYYENSRKFREFGFMLSFLRILTPKMSRFWELFEKKSPRNFVKSGMYNKNIWSWKIMTFSKILTLVSKNKKISSTHNVFQMAYENWCIFFFDITPKFILAKYEVSKIQNKYRTNINALSSFKNHT